jgi:hypothetical protein
MVLAGSPSHVPTIAERRADVCARSDLVVLEGPLVASSNAVVEHGVLKSVSVRDASDRQIAESGTTSPSRRHAKRTTASRSSSA